MTVLFNIINPSLELAISPKSNPIAKFSVMPKSLADCPKTYTTGGISSISGGPGVDTASNRNEHQESSWQAKAAGA
jgi:hypothetical protein